VEIRYSESQHYMEIRPYCLWESSWCLLNCGQQKNTIHAGDQTLVIQLVQEDNINTHLK